MKKIFFLMIIGLCMCLNNQALASLCSPKSNCHGCTTASDRSICEKTQAEIEYLKAKQKALNNCNCNCHGSYGSHHTHDSYH
ncbi:MAG: hypothetical protein II944_04060 [Ruminobacter sp.]|nr:hypothetical protein [Ruminobacter sp.]